MRSGSEPGADGFPVGRDPRSMSRAELEALGHRAISAQKALRLNCLSCCAGSDAEVKKCVATGCAAWPFRLGRSPWKEKRVLSTEQRQSLAERGRQHAAQRRGELYYSPDSPGAGQPPTTLPAPPVCGADAATIPAPIAGNGSAAGTLRRRS
jgi:hypothetical protein